MDSVRTRNWGVLMRSTGHVVRRPILALVATAALALAPLAVGAGAAPSAASGGSPVAGGITWVDSDLDANSVADPGEPLTVHAAVTNDGDVRLPAGTATLAVVSGPATVTRGTSSYGPIPPGATRRDRTAYQVRIAADATCGATVVLRHTYEAGGQSVTEDQAIGVGASNDFGLSFVSADVPRTITDGDLNGVTSALAVPAGTGTVGRVRVRLDIDHSYDSDLSATLISPAGTRVQLFWGVGGSGDDFTGTVFDDTANTPIVEGTPPFTGRFVPEGPLAAVNGEQAAGTWQLALVDTYPLDEGTLTGWSLDIAPDRFTCTAVGAYVDVTAPATLMESDGTATLSATLVNPAPATAYSVTLATQNGTAAAPGDYTTTTKTLTWAAGTTAAKQLTVPIIDDQVAESDEDFLVKASGGGLPATQARVTIRDDERDTHLELGDPDPVVESNGPIRFAVTLVDPDPAQTYTVDYAVGAGTATQGGDFDPTPAQTLTFAPDSPRTQVVSVGVYSDVVDEPDETVVLDLDHAQSTTAGPIPADRVHATATIVDDDPTPEATVDDVTVPEGTYTDGTTNQVLVEVRLSNPSASIVGLQWRTRAGQAGGEGDYEPSGGIVTFSPGETVATVHVPVIGDALDERDETFTVRLSDPEGLVIADDTATVTVADDDAAPTVSLGAARAKEGNAGTTSFVFPVTLSTESGRAVAFRWSTADGTATVRGKDFTPGAGVISFDTGETTAKIVVKVRGDRTREGSETFSVVGSSPVHTTFVKPKVTGTIVNDDA